MIEDRRLDILAWAERNGVLADYLTADSGGDANRVPFPDGSAEFFRTRKIVRVVADTDKGRLIVYSRLPIAKAKQAQLRSAFADAFQDSGVRLVLDSTKPFKVDKAVESYGRFEPIRKYKKRISCGSSIGLGNQRNAGTLTALARKKGEEGLFGISCNHVTGGCGTARPGIPIVMPGIQDVDHENNEIMVVGDHDAVAHMAQGLPSVRDISINRDLAYFRIRDPRKLTSMQGAGDGAFDTPTRFATPEVGMTVKKWGRSTRLTKGEISLVNGQDEPIEYNVQSFLGPLNAQTFRGTVYYSGVIEVSSSGTPFSLGGDSGALVVTDAAPGKERVIGIIIAGERTKSLVLPLKPALSEHGLTLISGHNI